MHTSVTLQEVTAPVKLPIIHQSKRISNKKFLEWYFKNVSFIYWRKKNLNYNFPLILHRKNFIAMHNYSKGARGLSVQPQEFRIFTKNSISLSLHWRQQDSRYAIHAGHQLNAKEFRYLRTVRVTAAVYWEFQLKQKTSPINLAALGRRQSRYVFLRISRDLCFC